MPSVLAGGLFSSPWLVAFPVSYLDSKPKVSSWEGLHPPQLSPSTWPWRAPSTKLCAVTIFQVLAYLCLSQGPKWHPFKWLFHLRLNSVPRGWWWWCCLTPEQKLSSHEGLAHVLQCTLFRTWALIHRFYTVLLV